LSQIEVITGEASKRYAQALLDLACESKSLKIIENDISKLKKILLESNDLQKAISSPVIDVEKKVAVLTSIAKAASLSKLSTQFIGTVTKNRRSYDLLNILSFFQVLVANKKGTQLAKLTSAKSLTTAQLKEIKSNLKKTDVFAQKFISVAPKVNDLTILGPSEPVMGRIRGRYRRRILVQSRLDFNLSKYMQLWRDKIKIHANIKLQIDIDPQSFM
jgi:ATP synthase F1 delta subunit